jgi:hypothetical protein
MSEERPKCDKCGAEITTGLMAAFCPRYKQCEFYVEGIEEFMPRQARAQADDPPLLTNEAIARLQEQCQYFEARVNELVVCRDALKELVAVKDLKRSSKCLAALEYDKRKPLAWEAARKALK